MAIQFRSSSDFTQKTNEQLKQLVTGEEVSIRINLKELLEDRGINISKLAEITGIRNTTLGNYVKNSHTSAISLEHLLAICIALRITDLSQLIQLEVPTATKSRWTKEVKLWKQNDWQPVYKKGQ